MDHVRAMFADALDYAQLVRDCVSRSSVWVIATSSVEFKALDDSFVTHKPATIIDCWRLVDVSRFSKRVNYMAVGRFREWTL